MYASRYVKNGEQMSETVGSNGCINTRTRKRKGKRENSPTTVSKNLLGVRRCQSFEVCPKYLEVVLLEFMVYLAVWKSLPPPEHKSYRDVSCLLMIGWKRGGFKRQQNEPHDWLPGNTGTQGFEMDWVGLKWRHKHAHTNNLATMLALPWCRRCRTETQRSMCHRWISSFFYLFHQLPYMSATDRWSITNRKWVPIRKQCHF